MSKEQNAASQALGGGIGALANSTASARCSLRTWSTMTRQAARRRVPRESSNTGGLNECFPDFQLDVDVVLADEDAVTLAYRLSGTHRGEWMGHAPTGERFEVRVERQRGRSSGRWRRPPWVMRPAG